MAIEIAATGRVAMTDALLALADGGNLHILAGASQDPDDAPVGTLLVNFVLPSPAYGGAVDNGTRALATANPIASVNAAATGTAARYRILNSGAEVIMEGTVGLSGSGADMIIDATSITIGVQQNLNSLTHQGDQTR